MSILKYYLRSFSENSQASLFSSPIFFFNNLFHDTKECDWSPSDSARALVNALTAQKQTLKTLPAVTVVLSDSDKQQAFIDGLSLKEKPGVIKASSKHEIVGTRCYFPLEVIHLISTIRLKTLGIIKSN